MSHHARESNPFTVLLRLLAGVVLVWLAGSLFANGRSWHTRGEIQLAMPDGRRVPALYEVRWGHFVAAPHLAEPGLSRLITLTFTGRVLSASDHRVLYSFEESRVPFTINETDSPEHGLIFERTAGFSVGCLADSATRVTIELRELGRVQMHYTTSGRGGSSSGDLASIGRSYEVDQRDLAFTLLTSSPGRGPIVLGSASQEVR